MTGLRRKNRVRYRFYYNEILNTRYSGKYDIYNNIEHKKNGDMNGTQLINM